MNMIVHEVAKDVENLYFGICASINRISIINKNDDTIGFIYLKDQQIQINAVPDILNICRFDLNDPNSLEKIKKKLETVAAW